MRTMIEMLWGFLQLVGAFCALMFMVIFLTLWGFYEWIREKL